MAVTALLAPLTLLGRYGSVGTALTDIFPARRVQFDAPDAEQCFRVGGPKARPHRGTCALFEFLWHTLLGEPPILDPRRTMSGQRGDIEEDPAGTAAAGSALRSSRAKLSSSR